MGSENGQVMALAAFTALGELSPVWAGKLILSTGLADDGCALAAAAVIAGAGCLTVEGDAGLCRGAMRTGAVDFVVNTVDEALRVLKNELRKGQPVSVGLEMDTLEALGEMEGRGIAPQVVGVAQGFAATARLSTDTASPGVEIFRFPSGRELKILDERLLRVLVPGDWRRRWVAGAARLFPRDRFRAISLSPEELISVGGLSGGLSGLEASA